MPADPYIDPMNYNLRPTSPNNECPPGPGALLLLFRFSGLSSYILNINLDISWVIQLLNSVKSLAMTATLAHFTASASRSSLSNRSWPLASPPCAYVLLSGGG